MMPVSWYKMHDSDLKTHPGVIQINPNAAYEANQEGYGIFWSVNAFNGPRRIENLLHINAWAIDLDTGTKPEMLEKIKSGLVPTMLVETKRGFHVYFGASDAKQENHKNILLDRLVPFYGADKNARDLARILRVPGFYHMKDKNDPFLIQKVWTYKCLYSEAEMMAFYPEADQEKKGEFFREIKKEAKQYSESDDLWRAVYDLDCAAALARVSGSEAVGGDTFDLKRTSKGNYNIFVNGKSSSCWVDTSGRIGSLDHGGPTIAQWINWYHKDYKRTVKFLMQHFPELPWKK